MALESAVNFKAAIATAAVDLTTALQDTVLTELATDVKDARHPLRQIEKLFTLNPATGVFTSDDAYIDAAYAGEALNKGKLPIGAGGVGAETPLSLTTATVEDAADTNVVLTFNKNIGKQFHVSLGGDAAPAKVISGIVIADNVVTITVTVAYVVGNTITVSGVFQPIGLSSPVTLAAQAVTNNVI